jgi:hypothetical protein
LEQSRVNERRAAEDHIFVQVSGRDERDLSTRLGKQALERARVEQPVQQADVLADEPVPVVMYRPDVGGDTQLNVSRFARYAVVASDQTAKPVWDRVDQPRRWDGGRDDHEHPITAIFVCAARPRDL